MEKIKKTSDGKKGGLFTGKSHAEGGIPAIVVDTGQPIEVEGGEAIINKKATAKYWKELSKINQSTGGVPIPPPDRADELLEKFEKGGKLTQLEKKTIHRKWKNLVNMTYTQLKKYYDSRDGKSSGLTQAEADKLGIDSGRESAVWIMKMKRTNFRDWTPEMWRWAKKQISFISRMRGNQGELMLNGKRTPKLKSLLIWGHNPYKYEGGGDIPRESKYPLDINSLEVMLKYASKEEAPHIQAAIDAFKQETKETKKQNRIEYLQSRDKNAKKPSDLAFALVGAKTLLKHASESEKEDIEAYIKGLEILAKISPQTKIVEKQPETEPLIFKSKKYDITYSVEQRPDGRWTVFAESPNFEKNDQYAPSGLASKEDAIDLAKLSAGITKEEDPEKVFLATEFADGGGVEDNMLLAPNGKPSNLNAQQYQLVRTPEFKAWFGDWEKLELTKINDSGIDEVSLSRIQDAVSKVVDENGEPLVVYHGTSSEFFEFKKTENSRWETFWFSPRLDTAQMYSKKDGQPGKVLQCFLNIKKPNTKYPFDTTKFDGYIEYKTEIDYSNFNQTKKIEVIQVVNSSQIKLADGTNTTFDGDNPDIRFDKGGVSNSLTYKEKYNKKYGYELNESHSLEEISKDTGVSIEGLQEIYNKGIGAYRTNPESVRPNVKSPEQWAMARVYSAVMGGKTARIDQKELKMNNGGAIDGKDKVTLDVPLLIRILELSREDIKSDAELHKMVERILDLKNKETLTMDDYDFIAKIHEKGISKAHQNLTRKKGKPEYAPTAEEISDEIKRMTSKENQFDDGGSTSSKMVIIESPIEMLDEINFNGQFKDK